MSTHAAGAGTRLVTLLIAMLTAWTAAQVALAPADHGEWATSPSWRSTVNVNTAGAAELTLLPGIGPRMADRIVVDRSANGRFASLEELERVPGIGPRTVTRVSELARAE